MADRQDVFRKGASCFAWRDPKYRGREAENGRCLLLELVVLELLELLELLLVMMDNSVIVRIASSERGGRLHVLFQLV